MQTYGQEELEAGLYAKHLIKVRGIQKNLHKNIASGLARVLSAIFLFYGYAVGLGSLCRENLEVRPGVPYTGGKLITIMFCTITASFALGFAGNNVKEVTEARIAGRMAYETIDNQPDVDPRKSGTIVNKNTLNGRIEFKNVNFEYPTRKDLRVLKNFSATIDSG